MNFQAHSDTSKGAYLSLSHEQTQLEYIYELICASENKGLTGREIAESCDLPIGTVSARLRTLCRNNRVMRSNLTRRVGGRMSTICYADKSMMFKTAPESAQKRDRLRGLVKELLTKKTWSGALYLTELDVKRLEKMIK